MNTKLLKNFVFLIMMMTALVIATQAKTSGVNVPGEEPKIVDRTTHVIVIEDIDEFGLTYNNGEIPIIQACGACSIGCANNVLSKIKKFIADYYTICNFQNQHPFFQKFITNFLTWVATAEGLNRYMNDFTYQSILNFVDRVPDVWRNHFTSLAKAKNFLDYLRAGKFDFDVRNYFWQAVDDDLTRYAIAQGWPNFYKNNLLIYVSFIRQYNIYNTVYRPGDMTCIPFNKYLVLKLKYIDPNPSSDPDADWWSTPDEACSEQKNFKIDENAISRGGWVAYWWVLENKDELPESDNPEDGIEILSGYVDNQQIYSVKLYRAEKNTRVGHLIKFGSIPVERKISTAACVDLAFVIFAVYKDCDKYRLWFSIRWDITAVDDKGMILGNGVKEDASSFTPPEVHRRDIENVQIKFQYPARQPTIKYEKYTPEKATQWFRFAADELIVELIETHDICSVKVEGCKYTNSLGQCSTCDAGEKLFEGKCYNPCPNGTFEIAGDKCQKCHERCKLCTADGNINHVCQACNDPYVLQAGPNGNCQETCDNGYFATDGICKVCTPNCLTCATATTCKVCTNSTYLQPNGTCDLNCPDGWYKGNDFVCHQCSKACKKCRSLEICDECVTTNTPNYFKNPPVAVSGNVTCEETCPSEYWADVSTHTCKACIDKCEKCNNSATCIKCNQGYFLQDDKTCKNDCQVGQVQDSIDRICVDCAQRKDNVGERCLACKLSSTDSCDDCDGLRKFIEGKWRCVNTCGDGYFVDENQDCRPCKDNCKTCTTSNDCQLCYSPFILQENTLCLEDCSSGYIPNEAETVCVKCTDLKCRKCKLSDLDYCTDCKGTDKLYNGDCYTPNCPTKTWESSTNRCTDCIQGCLTCKNSHTCDVCDFDNGWYWKQDICVKDCGSGWRLNGKKCEECTVTDCAKCDEHKNKCTKCKGTQVLYNNVCYPTCPDGTYQSGDYCYDCKTGCKKCTNDKNCSECNNPLLLQPNEATGENDCQKNCSDLFGFNANKLICEKCHNKTCLRCDKSLCACSQCPPKQLLKGKNCVTECGEGWYSDGTECHQCLDVCKTCSDARSCIDCVSPYFLYKANSSDKTGECRTTCPPGFWPNEHDKTCDACDDKRCNTCDPVSTCNQCLKEIDGKVVKLLIEDGKCVDNCSSDRYEDGGRCLPCGPFCKSCKNAEWCKVCDNNHVLKHGKCVEECGDGWVQITGKNECVLCNSNCRRCKSNSETNKCTHCYGTKWIYKDDCIENCPKKTWGDSNATPPECKPCNDSDCLECYDSGKKCKTCETLLLYEKDENCKETCPRGSCLSNNKKSCKTFNIDHCKECSQSGNKFICNKCDKDWFIEDVTVRDKCSNPCKDHYFKFWNSEAGTGECKECSDNCRYCNDEKNCTECNDSWNLYEKKCIKTCPPGYTSVDKVCVKCNVEYCDKCNNRAVCDECKPPRVLQGNVCQEDCNDTFFNNKGKCENCGPHCKKCKDCTHCTECLTEDGNEFNLNEDEKCVDDCPSGWVSVNKVCKKCTVTYCDTCKKDTTTCEACQKVEGKQKVLYKEQNVCLDKCPDDTYRKGDECIDCSTVTADCNRCTNKDTCTGCEPGTWLWEGKCGPCGDGLYSADDGKCHQCPEKCKTCKSSTHCYTCKPTFVLQGNTCQDKCDDGYFEDRNHVCQKCDDEHCKKCSSASVCTECYWTPKKFYLQNNKCVENCCPGYNKIENEKKCVPCTVTKCKTCPQTNDCTECKDNLNVLINSQQQTSCTEDCGPGKYADQGKCKNCIENCTTCTNGETCDECDENFNLWPDFKACKVTCPSRHTGISKKCTHCTDQHCLACPGKIDTCTQCDEGAPLLKEGKCVTDCGVGYFQNPGTKDCLKCDGNCLTCQTTAKTCTSCIEELTLQGTVCQSVCNDGYVEINNVCEKCKVTGCKTCLANKETCVQCQTNPELLLKENKCETTCGNGWFKKPGVNECDKCILHCKICQNATQCQVCDDHWYLNPDKTCKDSCPETYRAPTETIQSLECKPCTKAHCARCKNDVNVCTECSDNWYLKNKGCVECDQSGEWKFYYDAVAKKRGTCEDCLSGCAVCPSSTECDSCAAPKVKQVRKGNTYCQDKCDTGFTADSNRVCQKCVPTNCDDCSASNLNVCTTCSANYHIKNGLCVDCCGERFTLHKPSNTCLPCEDDHCLVCNPKDTCTRCEFKWFVYDDGCVPDKCPKGFYTPDGLRCKSCGIDDCEECHENNKGNVICDKCATKNLWDNTCINCPQGTYAQGGKCHTCPLHCKDCSNGTSCNECKLEGNIQYKIQAEGLPNQFLCVDNCDVGYVQTNTIPYKCAKCEDVDAESCEPDNPVTSTKCQTKWLYKGNCVDCNWDGVYKDGKDCKDCEAECKKCTAIGNCQECKHNPTYYFLQGTQCKDKCNKGWVPDDNGVCVKCTDVTHCLRCDWRNPSTCYDCEPTYKLANPDTTDKGKCIATCPAEFWSKTRNPGPYMDCEHCLPFCVNCDNSSTCIKCGYDKVLAYDTKSCKDSCDDGEVAVNGKCEKCKNNKCKKCANDEDNTCTQCYPTGTYPIFHQDYCIDHCPDPYYQINDGGVLTCKKCPTNCTSCTDATNCTACRDNYFIFHPNGDKDKADCVSDCGPHYVPINGVCKPCSDSRCKYCGPDVCTCLECDQGFLFGDKCVDNCPRGYRGENHACVKCSPHCYQCDGNKCNVCQPGFYFQENDPNQNCVPCDSCDHSIVGNVCKKCKVPGCLNCKKGTDDTCVYCDVGYFLLNGKCPTTCEEGFFINANRCNPCSANCAACTRYGTGVSCDRCKEDYLLKDGSCIPKTQECGVGYVKSVMEGKCKPCMQSSCNQCNADNQLECTSCQAPFLLYNGLCVWKCPVGTFYSENRCITCSEDCLECGATSCERCKGGMVLLNGSCVKGCGNGYYLSGDKCVACTDGCKTCPDGKCKECNEGKVLDVNAGTCGTTCPTHFFANGKSRLCEHCHASCDTCDAFDHCLSCRANLFLHENKCIPTCPDGMTNVGRVCESCTDGNCRRCAADNKETCEVCKNGFVRHLGKCGKQCDEGYFVNHDGNNNLICSTCKPECKTCSNGDRCDSCKNGLVLGADGSCNATCPEGHGLYKDKCLPCDNNSIPNCKICDSSLTNCIVCKDNFPLLDGKCPNSCGDGFYKDQNVCHECNHACKKCTDNKTCSACKAGYFLYGNTCLQDCPTGYFNDCTNNVCTQCNSACDECNGNTNNDCVSCAEGFFRSKHTACVGAAMCEIGTYADADTQSCARCTVDFCTACDSKGTCKACIDGFKLNDAKTSCDENRLPVNILTCPRYYSPFTRANKHDQEQINFNTQISNAKVVQSAYVSLSFWFRGLKSSLINGGAFQTAVFQSKSAGTPPIQSFSFVVKSYDGKTQTCELRSTTPEPSVETYVLSTLPCGEADTHNWQFFLISIVKSVSGHATLRVIVRTPNTSDNGYTQKDYTSSIPFNYPIITKDTVIEFNNADIGDAYEIFNSYIMDYEPNTANIDDLFKIKPNTCDYGCELCTGHTCSQCKSTKLAPTREGGVCNPVSFVVNNGLGIFDSGFKFNLNEYRRESNKHFVSDEWGFETYFFIDAPNESYNTQPVNLVSLQLDDTFVDGITRPVLAIRVADGYVYVNNQKQDNIRVRANHWYGLLYKVSSTSQSVYVVRQDNADENGTATTPLTQTANFLRVYDDLHVWVGIDFSKNPVAANGSFYNFFFYPNRAPDTLNAFYSPAAGTPGLANCKKYAKDLKCFECKDGYKITENGCINTIIGDVYNLQSKFSLWTKDAYNFPLGANLVSDQFTVSFFLRKKTHSTTTGRYNLLSIKNKNGDYSPVISARNNGATYLTTYHFGTSESVFADRDYTEANYDWDLFVATFSKNGSVHNVNVVWRHGANKKVNGGNLIIADDVELVWGDVNGTDMNVEIAYANYYPVVLDNDGIDRVVAQPPKDCSPSCLDCNYDSGFCRNCAIGGYAGDTCKMYMKGFKFAYIFGVNDVTSLSNPSNWVFNLSDHFKKDVNSGSYSVIGYFKIYDLAQIKAAPGNYVLFRVGNTNRPDSPNTDPSTSLIGFEAQVTGNAISYNFVVNQNNSQRVIPVTGLQMLEDQWYIIYAAVDVATRQFNYKITYENAKAPREWSTTSNPITLVNFPERLQENGSLKLFGVNSKLGANNKTGNGQFHNFYLNIDLGWKADIYDQYKSAVDPPKTPVCFDHCTRCVGVDSSDASRNICAACAENYTLNGDDRCIQNTDLFDYGYYSLVEGFLQGPRKFTITDSCFLDYYRATLGFYIRKNYQPEKPETERVFFIWGNLSIGITSTTSNDSIVFRIGDFSMNLENFVGDGRWNYLSFRITDGKITGQLIGPTGDITNQKSITFGNVWSKTNEVDIHTQNSMLGIYSVNYFSTSFLGAKLVDPPAFECSIDCEKCTGRGYCKQCKNGPSNVDGTCPVNPVRFYNTRVENGKSPVHLPLNEFIPESSHYRSRKFSFIFTYTPGQATGRNTVFRLNNLDHNGEDANSIAFNHLVLIYEAPKKFHIRYHNRIIQLQNSAPKEFEIELSEEPENPEFFIAVTFDGSSNRFGGLIYNSENSWNKFGFTSIGNMDFLTNHSYFHLSACHSTATEFRNIEFYYEHVLSVDYLWQVAQTHLQHLQYDCKYGSIRNCDVCRTGEVVDKHCVPNTSSNLLQPINRVATVTSSTKVTNTVFNADSLGSFTLSFWFKRNNAQENTFGLVAVNLGTRTIYRLVVDRDNLEGTGYANDKANLVILSNIIDSRESYTQWIYVTVTYDFIRNINQLHTYVAQTKRSNFHTTRGHAGFVIPSKNAQINYEFGFTDESTKANSAPNFSYTSFTFTHEYLASQNDIFRFITVEPRACSSPCKNACSEDGICPLEDRLLNPINLTPDFGSLPATEIAKMPAFKLLKDVVPQFSYDVAVDKFLVSVNVIVSQWLNPTRDDVINNNVLLIVSNDYDIVHFSNNSVIPQAIIKKAILSIVHKDGNLIIYTGSDAKDNASQAITLVSGNIRDMAQIFIGIIVDYNAKSLEISFYHDGVKSSSTVSLDNLPDRVTSKTGFHVNDSVKNTACQCYDPRFDRDFEPFVQPSQNWRVSNSMCNVPPATSCSQCVNIEGVSSGPVCVQCAEGFSNILGKCLKKSVCSDWVDLENFHSSFGAKSHGDNDTDTDELPPKKSQN